MMFVSVCVRGLLVVCEERFVDGLISIFNEKIVKGKVKKKWKFKVRGRGSRVPLMYSKK